jgi:acyl carrier protein
VLAAKAAGAAHLDELTAGLDLDAFVMFSSAAAILGSAGQGNYGAANAFLDALAVNRRGRGLPATSVAWGPWAGGGLAQGSAAARARLRRGPLPAMDPDLAIAALGQALDGGDGLLAVMDVDWPQFAAAQAPFLRDLPEIRRHHPETPELSAPDHVELARRLAAWPQAEQDQFLTALVRAEAAAILGHPTPDAIDPGQAFKDLGFDSLTAVELRNRLNAITGLRLPATLVFDYANPAALAGHLRGVITSADVTVPLPLLAELDKLESMLATTAADDVESARITARLEAVTAKWKDIRRQMDEVAVADKLEASTDDEIFDFIGKELGIS